MPWNDGDIDTMLTGLGGVSMTHGSETGTCILDSYDEHVLQGLDTNLIGQLYAGTIRTSAFPTLKNGDSVVVGGVTYKVHDRVKLDDGATTKLLLRTP